METELIVANLSEALKEAIDPMGAPTTKQLALMNKYRPLGQPKYSAEEMVTIPIVASNNLLAWSPAAWHPNTIARMAETYYGKPFEVDHNWWDVRSTFGFVYDTQYIVSDTAPDEILSLADNYDYNKQIVDQVGYHQLVLYAAIQASRPDVDDIKYARYSNVSTGGITDGTMYCPLDGTKFKRNGKCEEGHYHPYMEYWLEEDELDMLAPFFIRDGWIDAIEISAVLSGNLPAAMIPRAA